MASYTDFLDDKPPEQARGWWRFVGRHLPSISVLLMASLLIATVLFPYVVITVPSHRVLDRRSIALSASKKSGS